MSRIGNSPVLVPKDVTLTIQTDRVIIKGTKGELVVMIPSGIGIKQEGDVVTAERLRNDRTARAAHGTVVALLKNAITGVTKGWTKQLELSGVGYRAALAGANVTLSVGFSHPVVISPPAGITFAVTDAKIMVSGIDKYLVGQTAATIRGVRPPEPYKGKGIKYTGEHIRRKAGKSAKAVGGAPGAK